MANNKARKTTAKVTPQIQASAPVAGRFSLNGKLALLLALLSFIVYANTLKNDFAMDDSVMLVNNRYVHQGISAIPMLLATPHQHGFFEKNENDEYRPLALVSHAIVFQFFGLNPVPYHLVNILLFAGCVILLFRFLRRLFVGERTGVAFLAALLFAMHPLHTEVVANVKSSDELLCFLFAFLGLNVFVSYTRSGRMVQLIAGFLCIFLAFLSKETVVTFLGIAPLIFFFYRNWNRRRSVYILGVTLLATGIFLAIRYGVLTYYDANHTAKIHVIENALAMEGLSAESRLATAVLILGYYLKLLFVPYPLISEYSYNTIPFTHFSDPRVLLILAAYVTIAVIGILRFIKNKKDPYAFGIFFFFMTIVLFSNIFFLVKSTMGERFMFFPSVSFCLVLALLLEKWLAKPMQHAADLFMQKKVWITVVPLCITYAVIAIDRNGDWKDNHTLYGADVKKTPGNAHMTYLYGYDLFARAKDEPEITAQQKMQQEAIANMRASVLILPYYFYALTDLGAAYFTLKQYDSAEVYDLAALKVFPDAPLTRNNLSSVLMTTGQFRRNIAHCKQTIELTRFNGNGYADIGFSYMSLSQTDSAIYYLRMGIAAVPDFFGCYDVLGHVYNNMGQTDSFRKYQSITRQLLGR